MLSRKKMKEQNATYQQGLLGQTVPIVVLRKPIRFGENYQIQCTDIILQNKKEI